MADSQVTVNATTVPSGPQIAVATDGSGFAWQKVVVANEAGGTPSAVTGANPLAVSQTGTAIVGGSAASGGANSGNPVKVGGVYNSSPITVTTGQIADAQVDANGFLKVNIAAGAAAGGTSSSFGSAYPAAGTAIGAKDSTGTNLVALNVDASGFLKVNVAAGATQAVVDNSTGFTSGTSQALPIAGFYQTSPTALTSGDFGIPQLSKNRELRIVMDADSAATIGLSYYSLVAPASAAATAVKTTPGSLAFIHVGNISGSPAFVKFYNTAAGSVTLGTTPAVFQICVPGNAAGAGMVVHLPIPFAFSTAITYAVTSGIALTDNTGITASTVAVTFGYA